MGGQPFRYDIDITAAPREMPGDGWKVRLGHTWYNVYEPQEGLPPLPPGHVRGFWKMGREQEIPRFLEYRGPAVHVVTPVSGPGSARGRSSPLD